MPLLARVLGYYFDRPTHFEGAYSMPVPISLSCCAVGFLFLWYAIITFNFPTESPVNYMTMNYTSAAVGIVILTSLVTWFTSASERFTGPADVGDLLARSQECLSNTVTEEVRDEERKVIASKEE